MTAMHEPNIQILKYRLLNQSLCIGPALTTNSQKQSSAERARVPPRASVPKIGADENCAFTFEVSNPGDDWISHLDVKSTQG